MRYSLFIVVGTWALICGSSTGRAQLVNHLDISSGLINNKVYSIAQDERGFMWIGTANGLQRYDGSQFVNYRQELLDPDNSAAAVYSICPARQQLQLLINYRLGRLDLLSGRFRYDQAPGAVDSTLQLRLACKDTLLFPLIRTVQKSLGVAIYQAVKDSRHNLWFSSRTGLLYKYNLDSHHLRTYSLAAIAGRSFSVDRDFTMAVNCIFEDNRHRLWVGTENAGLLAYDPLADNFSVVQSPDQSGPDIRYNYIIICIFQDRDDNLWIGTDKGISIFNPYRQYFSVIRNKPRNRHSLPKREINGCIQTGKGAILVGTWGGGITEYDSLLHWMRNISFSKGQGEKNLIWGFLQSGKGSIWVSCQHGFLHLIDPITGSVRTFRPPEMEGSTIRCMTSDAAGNIWFGLHNGRITEWDAAKKKFFAMAPSTPHATITNIFIDKEGHFWVSTERGFSEFDPVSRTYISTFLKNDVDLHTLSANGCSGIEEINDSLLLIATENGGLDIFHKKTRVFTRLTHKDGLPSDIVHALKMDQSGRMWFTTDYGLYSFRPTFPIPPGGFAFAAYGTEKNTVNAPFVSSRFYPTHDGRWMTYTPAELICFNPDSLCRQPEGKTEVTITGFKVFDKPYAIDSLIYLKQPIRLSHRQNFLEIGFRVLNFSTLQPITYSYQLSRVDKDWASMGDRQSAAYTDLPPGEYVFRVRAQLGSKAGPTTTFSFVIIPPFWSTVWFRAACLLLITSVLFLLVLWRIRAFRAAEARKSLIRKEMAEMEMKVLRTQMNPHFLFNSLNSINGYILENDMDMASDYLAMFSRLMRMILDHSQQLFIPLDQELSMLDLYLRLESMRFGDKFNYSIHVDKRINPLETLVPSMLLQPYAENAIWHGLMHKAGKGILVIGITGSAGEITVNIEDNGIGRRRSGELRKDRPGLHQSKGMKLTEQRLELLAREKNSRVEVRVHDLEDPQGIGTGTRIEIHIGRKEAGAKIIT